MDNLFLLLAILGFLGVPICFIIAIINLFRRKKVKPLLISCGISFLLSIAGFIGFGFTYTETPKTNTAQGIAADAETVEITQTPVMPEATTAKETLPVPETSSTPETALEPETTTVPETTSIAPSDRNVFAETLKANPDVTEKAANDTYDILTNELGFEKLIVENNSMGTLFKINADGFTLKVTVSDKPYMIICGDYNMYQNDTVNYTKQDLDNRDIGSNDSTYYVIAKEIVKNNLKNPSSAKFCSVSECQMARKGEYVAVKGYVDAINSFNSQVRNEFLIEFKVLDLSSYSYETIYININGDSSGTYVDLK